jgi:uncharacterized protein
MKSQTQTKNIKVIFIPGNGGDGNTLYGWFPYVKDELEKIGVQVIAPIFPDGNLARDLFWLPFLDSLNVDKDTILIGHSSGAIASMKYAEKNKIMGSVLVSAYYTDLGLDSERISGYFNKPFDWQTIKNNQKWIIQFNSTNDHSIPITEARFVRDRLQSDYYELSQGHFMQSEFPELVQALKKYLQ